MRVLMVGLSHHTAPLSVRELLAVGESRLPGFLARFAERYEGAECVCLSTCNRTELYIARRMHASPEPDELRAYLCETAQAEPNALDGVLLERSQGEALGHLFRVTAGLDSMVLGETQVLGQVRRAYEAADRAGTVGPVLHQVFQQSIATAKRLHTTTGIGAGRHSVGSVGVDFIKQVFDRLDDKTVLCLGAGEVGKVVLQHVLRLSPGRVRVVNRTTGRAEALAARLALGGEEDGARPWESLDEQLIDADVVIACTGATEPILDAARMKPVVKRRRGRPLFMLDAAVPRDIDPAVGGLSNVYLYNLDDLRPVVEANLAERADEFERARAQVRGAAAVCLEQIQHSDVGRMIRELRQKLHAIADDEKRRTLRKLDAVTQTEHGERVEAMLDEHTRRLINKVLHMPLSRLDHGDPEAPLGFYAAALRRLFDLGAEPSSNPGDTKQEQAQHQPSPDREGADA